MTKPIESDEDRSRYFTRIKPSRRFWLGFKTWATLLVAAQYVDLIVTVVALDSFRPGFSEANPIALIRISAFAGFLGKLFLPLFILLVVWKMRERKAHRIFLYAYTLLTVGNVIYNFTLLAHFLF